MEGTSFAPNYRYEATRDVINKGPRKLYNHHSYPADITKIENFLQSPITASGSEYDGETNNSDVKMSDVIDVIRTDPAFSVPAKPTIRDTSNRDPAAPSADSLTYNQLPTFLNNPELLNRGQPPPVVPAEQSKSGAVKKGARGTVVRRSSVPAKPDNRDAFNRRGAESLMPRTRTELVRRHSERQQPYVKIIEQPAPKISRFRYVCESRSAGSFPGKSSTPDNPTYPTIQIVGFRGKAVIVVSCVTKDFPHKPHPFNLVSKASNEDYKKGICRLKVDTNENHGVIQFVGMGVQCVKRRGMAESLDVRRQLQVDPFGTGFAHRTKPTSIDLISVRLCFQVFIEGDTPGRFNVQLAPVVSDPVYDKRRATEPKIMKLSHCVSSVAGGTDVILLCEKVTRADIQIRFYEENGDWEAFADFEPAHIHKQYAICFKTPRYKTLDIKNPVKVSVQLRRPSDGATSESLPFELWPSTLLEQEPLHHKRKKTEKLMELRSLQEVAKGGRFPENFFTMDFSKPPHGGSHSFHGAPLTPQGGIANPLGGLETSGYAPNAQGPILEKETWNSPTYSSSQSSAIPPQYWNIPRNDVLHPPKCNPTTSPESKEVMDLDSGDFRWLMSLVEPQRHSLDTQYSLPNPDPTMSLINPSADRTPNDPNLTDSLSKMALNEFYRV